jgi:hypothetical protein
MKSPQKARKREMSKQAMREETERLVKEALERKTLTVKQGKTRIDSKCRKCGALNRVSAAQGQVRRRRFLTYDSRMSESMRATNPLPSFKPKPCS